MSVERKPNEIEAWKHFFEEEFQKMQKELEKISEPKLRSKLKDQLIWLRYQMKSFEETQDVEAIQEDFKWVANSFNHNLKPKPPFRGRP